MAHNAYRGSKIHLYILRILRIRTYPVTKLNPLYVGRVLIRDSDIDNYYDNP